MNIQHVLETDVQLAKAGESGRTRLDSRADFKATLQHYLKLYKHIPRRAIGSKTPILALKECQQKQPELFGKHVYDQTGLNI